MSRSIGRRTHPEYSAKMGLYYPPRGQVARGAIPGFAQGSACIGLWTTATLNFGAASLASGLTTMKSTASLTVSSLQTGAYDLGQAHFSTGAYATPSGMVIGHPSFQLNSIGNQIGTNGQLQRGQTYQALSLTGTVTVYAPSTISTPIAFAIPVTVAFLGDVFDA